MLFAKKSRYDQGFSGMCGFVGGEACISEDTPERGSDVAEREAEREEGKYMAYRAGSCFELSVHSSCMFG